MALYGRGEHERGYSSYQSASGQNYSYSDNEGEFTKLSKTVSSNIQKMVQNVAQLQRMAAQIGTPRDSIDLREKLHQTQHYTNQLAKETTSFLKELAHLPQPPSASDQRQRKMQNERLRTEFSDALNNFQTVQRTVAEKERASVSRARAHSGYGVAAFEEEEKKSDDHLVSPGFSQTRQVLQMEEDVDLELIHEREEAIRKLESDIKDVNQIFKELGVLVHEQGEGIDSIEQNVEIAQTQVEEGAVQLTKAREYQSKVRRKKCCLLITVIVLLAVLALVLGLVFGTR